VLFGTPALLVVVYIQKWIGLFDLPGLGGIDFISFYSAGRIARAGMYRQLYDLKTHYAIQSTIIGPDAVPGGVIMSQHPPFLAPLLGLISFDNYNGAYIAWTAVLCCVLALCGVVAARFLAANGIDRRSSAVLAIGAVLFYPIFISVLKGQDTAFVLLGALVWMWALQQGRERAAGVALALVWLKPQIALALAIPLLASRNRSTWWFCGATALLGLYSLLLVGWGGLIDLLGLMRLSAAGWGYGTNQDAMFNFLGLMLRSAPSIDGATLDMLKWAVYLLMIVLICWFWWGRRSALLFQQIGLAVPFILFASPHLHQHDLSLLLLPALGLVARLPKQEDWRHVAVLALLPIISLLCIASDLYSRTLHYLAGYGLMVGLVASLGLVLWAARQTSRQAAQEAPRDELPGI
jgi:alpha-1,2-mannosyltransferase